MTDVTTKAPLGLAGLRADFPAHQISKLPKGTKAQNECDFNQKRGCSVCGGFHHPDIKHLDYVGHAALTDRLLDCDPAWDWQPVAFGPDGLPAFDKSGGLWIKLTVCGVSRLGYGHAATKSSADAGAREKEVIGDALRNAAMRFGAALDLWHKGVLHIDEDAAANDRIKWLDDRYQAIMGALNVGELKRTLDSAVALAVTHDDSEAVDQLNAWAEKKRQQAKPRAA